MALKELDGFKAVLGGSKGATTTASPLVFVVDDDAGVRTSLDLALRRASYRVATFPNGESCVQALSDETSVVVLDIKMADRDGFAVYKDIQEKDADLPIVFHSAYQDLKDPYEVMNEFRPFGYVTKGDDLTTLLGKVSAAITERERVMRYRGLASRLGDVQSRLADLKRRMGKEDGQR